MATLTVNTNLADGAVTRAKLNSALVVTEAEGIASNDNDNTIPTSAAVKDYVDNAVGSGDVVGPASSTDNNVPQWDGTTGKLLKDGLGVSQGGNGAADALKLPQYGGEGQIRGSVVNSSTAAVSGESNGTGYAGAFSAGSTGTAVLVSHGGSGSALEVTSGTGFGVSVFSNGNVPLSVQRTGLISTGRLAEFAAGIPRTVELFVGYDGGLGWRALGTGAQTTATNLPAFGTSTKGVVPASGGGTTNFLRADGTWAAPPGGSGIADGDALSIGLTFPNAGLKMADQNADHTLVLVPNENLSADRQLSIEVNDANRALNLGAGLDLREGGDLRIFTGGGAPRVVDLDGDLTVPSAATVSGTNTGDQTITLTGDVTGSGTGSFAATIANDAVTFAKMQNIATDTLIGRSTSGTGDPEAITCTAAGRALLDDANANAQRETLGLIRRKVSTATTGVSTSYTDVTDLNFSVVSGTTYFINGWVLAECSNTSGGVCISANGPTATYYGARYEGTQTGGGSSIRADITAYDSLGALGDVGTVSAANTPYIYLFQAMLVPSANGTFTLRVKRGGGSGNVAVRAGMLEATGI